MERRRSEPIGKPQPDFTSSERKMYDLPQCRVAQILSTQRVGGLYKLLGCRPRTDPMFLALAFRRRAYTQPWPKNRSQH